MDDYFWGKKEDLGFGSFHYQILGQHFACINLNVLLDMKRKPSQEALICCGAVTELNVRQSRH